MKGMLNKFETPFSKQRAESEEKNTAPDEDRYTVLVGAPRKLNEKGNRTRCETEQHKDEEIEQSNRRNTEQADLEARVAY
jgi:hypothetical protein